MEGRLDIGAYKGKQNQQPREPLKSSKQELMHLGRGTGLVTSASKIWEMYSLTVHAGHPVGTTLRSMPRSNSRQEGRKEYCNHGSSVAKLWLCDLGQLSDLPEIPLGLL